MSDNEMSADEALQIARLWRAGKMLGADPYEVVDGLLKEIDRLMRTIDLSNDDTVEVET